MVFKTVHNRYNPHPWGKVFTLGKMRSHYGVTPIVAIMICWTGLLSSTAAYMLYTRDYQFDRSHKRMVHQTMDLVHPYPMKLLTFNQPYHPMEDLAQLLKEMDDEADKAEEEQK